MNAKALAMVVAVALALPARAQDVPFIEAPSIPNKLAPCQPGDVVLSPDAAVAAAKRLAAADSKVAVYEKHPPLPAWSAAVSPAAQGSPRDPPNSTPRASRRPRTCARLLEVR